MDYLCMEGYTKLLYNFDKFLDKVNIWIKDNGYTQAEAATISLGLLKAPSAIIYLINYSIKLLIKNTPPYFNNL